MIAAAAVGRSRISDCSEASSKRLPQNLQTLAAALIVSAQSGHCFVAEARCVDSRSSGLSKSTSPSTLFITNTAMRANTPKRSPRQNHAPGLRPRALAARAVMTEKARQ